MGLTRYSDATVEGRTKKEMTGSEYNLGQPGPIEHKQEVFSAKNKKQEKNDMNKANKPKKMKKHLPGKGNKLKGDL